MTTTNSRWKKRVNSWRETLRVAKYSLQNVWWEWKRALTVLPFLQTHTQQCSKQDSQIHVKQYLIILHNSYVSNRWHAKTQRQGFLCTFILYILALLKRLQQRSDATFMGELKGFCSNSKWQKICPSATVLSFAYDDGRANDRSVMQGDNSWEWMCPIVYLDYEKWANIPPFVFLTSSTKK
jgi:hypothetical protein